MSTITKLVGLGAILTPPQRRRDRRCRRQKGKAMSIYTMKRAVPAATLTLLLGTAAYAANIHLQPPGSVPSFTDNGLSLTAVINLLAGLGNSTGAGVFLNATANVDATCTNAGNHQAPGQNPAPISVTGSTTITPGDISHNGSAGPISVTTNPPPSTIAGAPDCPNPGWTEAVNDLSFTTASITVQQGTGPVTLVTTCTFNPPTANGPVPGSDVSCTK